jgi:hypothetical protein
MSLHYWLQHMIVTQILRLELLTLSLVHFLRPCNNEFICCHAWVSNLVSHPKGMTYRELSRTGRRAEHGEVRGDWKELLTKYSIMCTCYHILLEGLNQGYRNGQACSTHGRDEERKQNFV